MRKFFPIVFLFVALLALVLFALIHINRALAVAIPGFWSQTDDTAAQTGFNLAGNTRSGTAVAGSGSAAGVQLSPGSLAGTYTSAAFDTTQNSTYSNLTFSSTIPANYTQWTQTTDADFNGGTKTNTLVLGTGSVQLGAGDDFNSSTLDPAWTFSNPVGNASYSLAANPGHLQINVPAGSSHDCWTTGKSCATMLMNTSNTDATYITKIDGNNINSQFQSYGIMLWQDDLNYLRFEYWTNSSGIYARAYSVIGGTGNGSTPLIGSGPISLGVASNYLKVTRQGDAFSLYYDNGTGWNAVGSSFSQPLTINSAGVYVLNAGSSPVATAGNFDYFTITTPTVPLNGVFTSSIKQLPSVTHTLGTMNWATTTPANTSITMEVRTCAQADCSDRGTSWSQANVNGASIAGMVYTNNTYGYLQYRATFATADQTAVPSLNDVTIGINYSPMSIDVQTGSDTNSDNIPDTWASWQNAYTAPSSGALSQTNTPVSIATLPQNRYIKYRVSLATLDPSQSPRLEDVRVDYQADANYNFTLSSSPAPGDIVAGQPPSSVSTIAVNVIGAHDPIINTATGFTATSVPSGPVITFSSPSSCIPTSFSCSVAMFASGATAGTYAVTITGSNGNLWRMATFTLTIAPAMQYSFYLSSSAGEVVKGNVNSATTTLSVQYNSGANELVSVTNNAPAGVSLNVFSPNCRPKDLSPSPCVLTIVMQADSTVTPNTYPITINGLTDQSGNTASPPVIFSLTVNNPISYALTVAAPACAATNTCGVFQGNSINATIVAAYASGASENINFRNLNSTVVSDRPMFTDPATGLQKIPASGSISVTFTGSPCSLPAQSPCARIASISASNSATPGIYRIAISGYSSITNTVASTTFDFAISGPFDFSLAYQSPPCDSTSVCGGILEQSNSISIPVTMSSASLIGSAITISVSGLPAQDIAYHVTPNSCAPSYVYTCNNSITIDAGPNTLKGTYYITITATGGTTPVRQYSLYYTLTIAQGFTFDINLDKTSGKAIRGGASESVLVSLSLTAGTGKNATTTVLQFKNLADNTISTDLSGVSISFPNGTACVPDCQKQIIFNVSSMAGRGVGFKDTYEVTIQATAGGLNPPTAVFTLTIDDPFNFTLGDLSSTAGSIMQDGVAGAVTTLPVVWAAGGPDDVQFSAIYGAIPCNNNSGLCVNFSPTACLQMSAVASTCTVIISFSADSSIVSKTYPITIIASSGTIIQSRTFLLAVGTALDFQLDMIPRSLRLLQGETSNTSATSSLAVLATVISPPSSGSPVINFSVGDSVNYRLPAGVTIRNTLTGAVLAPNATFASSTLANVALATSLTQVVFNIAQGVPSDTFIIPIAGTDSTGVKRVMVYFTLKVGALTLKEYNKEFVTEPHQRPQFNSPVAVAWSPPAPFAGDTVNFTPSVKVYSGGSPLTADTPVDAGNMNTVTNGLNWAFTGIPVAYQNNSSFSPSIIYSSSSTDLLGPFSFSLTVADKMNDCGQSGTATCSCVYQATGPAGVTVSKPAPYFREIKP